MNISDDENDSIEWINKKIRELTDNGIKKDQITILSVKGEGQSIYSSRTKIGNYSISSEKESGKILFKSAIVATSALLFCIANYVKLAPYYFLGQLNLSNLSLSLLFAPRAPLGIWLGIWLHKRISEKTFFQISYLLLFFSGVKLIWDALA